MERIGVKVLIVGLAFQLAAFSLFLCVFRRFHVLALRMAVEDAPRGWQKVVLAVYISSILIMVSLLDIVATQVNLAGSLHLSCC